MNRNFFALKAAACASFLILMCGLTRLDAQGVRTNWANSMGPIPDNQTTSEMCVTLGPDNTVYIRMSVWTVTPNISSLPPMYFQWYLSADGGNIDQGMMPVPFTSSDFSLVPGTTSIYRAVYEQPYYCSSLCQINGNTGDSQGAFCFTRRTQLVTYSDINGGSYVPYPLGQYPNVWPSYIFPEVNSPNYTCPWLIETKRVCCYGNESNNIHCDGSHGGGGITIIGYNSNDVMDNSTSMDIPNAHVTEMEPTNTSVSPAHRSDEISVYPNPSSSMFLVRFHQMLPGTARVECLDAQGTVLRVMEEEHGAAGYYQNQLDASDFSPGIYYLRVSTPMFTKLTKIVKI